MKATGWLIVTGASVGTLAELMLSRPEKASTGLGGGGPVQPAASSISAPSAIILEIILAPLLLLLVASTRYRSLRRAPPGAADGARRRCRRRPRRGLLGRSALAVGVLDRLVADAVHVGAPAANGAAARHGRGQPVRHRRSELQADRHRVHEDRRLRFRRD